MATAGFRKGDKMGRYEEALADQAKALKQIGAIMVAESQEAFEEQALGDDDWEPRAVPNIFGLLADLSDGGDPKDRRFDATPALVDTGRLQSSITFALGKDTVTVGSNLDYAGIHHTGGTVESVEITGAVRRRLWGWLKKQDGELRRQLGWLLNRKFANAKLTTEVPRRPIVGITKFTVEAVEAVVGVKIFEAKG